MATLIEVYNQRVQNADLRNRVIAAVTIAAWNVFEEATPSAARLTWAREALANADGLGGQLMSVVCGNAAVQAANFAPTDGDVQYVVNTVRDKLAV